LAVVIATPITAFFQDNPCEPVL